MTATTSRLIPLAILSIALPLAARSEPRSAESKHTANRPGEAARTDLYGDLLPTGAARRFGALRLRYTPYGITAIHFADGDKKLVSFGWDRDVRVWDVETGKEVRRLRRNREYVSSVAVSRDGRLIATGSFSGGVVRVWEAATGKEVHTLHGLHSMMALAFSAEGKFVGVESSNSVLLRRLPGGEEYRRLKPSKSDILNHLDAIAFSPDGKTVAAGGRKGVVTLWDVASGKERHRLTGHSSHVFALSFSPDGKTLASGSDDGTVRLWDPATGKALCELKGQKRYVGALHWNVAFSPDGKTFASGGWDNAVRLWDVATHREVRRIGRHAGSVRQVAFSADGKLLATTDNSDAIRLWRVASGEEIVHWSGHQGEVVSLAVGRDGRALITGSQDGTVRFWESATGKESHVLRAHATGVTSVALACDGRTLASAGNDKVVRLWDVTTGKELRQIWAHKDRVTCVAFSPVGMALASGSRDRTVRIWDGTTGKELHCLRDHRAEVRALAFAPNGHLLASSQKHGETKRPDNDICLWDVRTGKLIRQLTGHTSTVHGLVFLAEGKRLASVSWRGIRIWDIDTGQELRRIGTAFGSFDHPFDIALSPDGRILAIASHDRAAHLLELASGNERLRLEGHKSSVSSVAFSPDGRLLYTGSHDTTALAWDLRGRLREGGTPALTGEDVRLAWDDLASPDARKAYRAVCRLGFAPRESLPWIQKHLRPAPRPMAECVARLIADLDGDRFDVRERASAELATLGLTVKSELRLAQKRPQSTEQRRRVEKLLEKLVDDAPDMLLVCRTVEVLEMIGTTEAKKLLKVLATGSSQARLTCEAAAALGRLSRQAAAERAKDSAH